MKLILISLAILSGYWMLNSTIGMTRQRVQIESAFSTLRHHAQSVLANRIEEKEKNEFLNSIELAERNIHQDTTRSRIPSIAAFTISLAGTIITFRKRNEG